MHAGCVVAANLAFAKRKRALGPLAAGRLKTARSGIRRRFALERLGDAVDDFVGNEALEVLLDQGGGEFVDSEVPVSSQLVHVRCLGRLSHLAVG